MGLFKSVPERVESILSTQYWKTMNEWVRDWQKDIDTPIDYVHCHSIAVTVAQNAVQKKLGVRLNKVDVWNRFASTASQRFSTDIPAKRLMTPEEAAYKQETEQLRVNFLKDLLKDLASEKPTAPSPEDD